MDRAFSTLRRRRTCVVNPTAKVSVPGRQVVKLLGSNSGRQFRERGRAAFMRFNARERFYDGRKNGVQDDDIDGNDGADQPEEAVKPLDFAGVRLRRREVVVIANGGVERYAMVGKNRRPTGKEEIMRMKRAKKEAVAAKLAERQEVAMEMKLGEDAAWERNLYELEYLQWWKGWDWEERVAPTLGKECLDDGFELTNQLNALVGQYIPDDQDAEFAEALAEDAEAESLDSLLDLDDRWNDLDVRHEG